MDITIAKINEMLESVDEYDGTLASCVRQGLKNAVRDHTQIGNTVTLITTN